MLCIRGAPHWIASGVVQKRRQRSRPVNSSAGAAGRYRCVTAGVLSNVAGADGATSIVVGRIFIWSFCIVT